MNTMEAAGKSKTRRLGKKLTDFGPSLNSGSSSRLPEHQQGGLPRGAVGPGEVGLGVALGGLGGLGGLQGGRRRVAMELPSVFD